jgi:hypothetical protein
MGLRESIMGAFSFLGTSSGKESNVAAYVIREHRRGRSVNEILADNYVTNRLTPEQVNRVLDRPEVIRALGDQIVAEARAAEPS